MPEILDLSDPEFTAQMQGLVQEAKQVLDEKATSVNPALAESVGGKDAESKALKAYRSLPDVLKPFVHGLEAITRVVGDNNQILGKLDSSTAEALEALKRLPTVVGELQGMIERKDGLSRQMFDALHDELRSYKDGFLLDSVHRPMIRDLITLYDDLSETHRQMTNGVSELGESAGDGTLNRFRALEMRISHNLEFVLEVLARFEVCQMPVGGGKLDKKTQRAVAIESAEDAERDLDIVRSVRRGFMWKDRIVRPEEVVIKKWKEGFLEELQPSK
jgi:molecular chaperone GrpE (heat shock protein)